MKNQVWGTNFLLLKVLQIFALKMFYYCNCFYYIDVYENGYFPKYCLHFFFYNSDLGTSGTITTKTKINIFWKQNFFKLGALDTLRLKFFPKNIYLSFKAKSALYLLFSTFQLIVSGLTFLIPTTRKFWSDLGRVTRR